MERDFEVLSGKVKHLYLERKKVSQDNLDLLELHKGKILLLTVIVSCEGWP